MPDQPRIAIVGAGIGGLAAAATLLRAGFTNLDVYDQASRSARVGAGIQIMPNSMKVLRGLGLEQRLKDVAFAPKSHLNRDWDSGAVGNELPMPAERYGAHYSAPTACIEAAFEVYEAHRKPRTSRIQAISSANTWLRTPDANPDWLYAYDAWTAPLESPAALSV